MSYAASGVFASGVFAAEADEAAPTGSGYAAGGVFASGIAPQATETEQPEEPRVNGGFVLVDAPSRLWWKRKPRALPEEEADEKLVKVARVIERIARQQVEAQTPIEQRRIEARQVVAPLVADMPGFDWSSLYRYALDRLIEQRLAEQLAGELAAQEIERIRLMSDEDDLLILLMAI